MGILIYVNSENYQAYQQLDAIHKLVPYPKSYVSSHEAFKQAYGQCLSGETIVVFFVNDDADLAFLEVMEKDFVDTKQLLIMANGNEQWVARAYKRNPRIVTRSDDKPELLSTTVQGIAREMNRVNGNKMSEEARKKSDYLLEKCSKLKEFQKEIDRRLNNAGNFEKRMAVLGIMIEAKLIELREQFSKLL